MAISITEDYPRFSQNHLRFTIDVHGTPFTTTVTSDPEVVRKWLRKTLYLYARFRHRLVVGLGVQWRPASYRGEKPPAATLQLCVGRRCLIFQLRHSPTVPNLLRHFLKDPNHTFVGMGNHSDADKLLESSEHELEMARKPVNLSRHVVSRHDGRRLHARASRETIVRECLGYDVDFNTRIGRSDWEKYKLDDEQILYAAVDAYCSFLIGKDLRAWEFVNICTAVWTQEHDLWAQEAQEQEQNLQNFWEDLWAQEAQEQEQEQEPNLQNFWEDLRAQEAQEQEQNFWEDLWAQEAQEQEPNLQNFWEDLWADQEAQEQEQNWWEDLGAQEAQEQDLWDQEQDY